MKIAYTLELVEGISGRWASVFTNQSQGAVLKCGSTQTSGKYGGFSLSFLFLIFFIFFFLKTASSSLGLSETHYVDLADLEFVVTLLFWFLKYQDYGHVPPNPPRKLLKIENITDISKSSSLEDKVRTISQKGKEKGRIRNNTCFDSKCTKRWDRKYKNQLKMTTTQL